MLGLIAIFFSTLFALYSLYAKSFVATVPAFMALWTNHDVVNHHRIRYTRHSLQDQLNRAGLKSVEMRYLYQWVAPLKIAARMRERLWHVTPSLPRASGGVANALSYWITRLEQKTLSRLRPPFGSSLLLVARGQIDPSAEALGYFRSSLRDCSVGVLRSQR